MLQQQGCKHQKGRDAGAPGLAGDLCPKRRKVGFKNYPQNSKLGVPVVAQWLTNPTRNQEVAGLIPGLAQWVKDPALPVTCGVGCRRRSDPALLWLWHRPAATALIQPLAWKPPYAAGAAQEIAKKKKKSNIFVK